jgi:16S rRNA (cytosine1402-N4)-methyltransferase
MLHLPVLAGEVLDLLALRPGLRVLDATVGAGGHAERILEGILPGGGLVGCDRDGEVLEYARKRLERFEGNCVLKNEEFSRIEAAEPFDRVLLDLGVSSLQLDRGERGFSFRFPGPLDMRMDRRETTTAADLVNRLSERDLADIIYKYGEEGRSRRISRFIVEARRREFFQDTVRLAETVARAVGRRGRIHPATKVFQALRIAVNQEMENLENFLSRVRSLLAPGGRICVISFHSLEDRLVKQAFRAWEREQGWAGVLTPKPLRPAPEEIAANPRARSARLRAAEKLQ